MVDPKHTLADLAHELNGLVKTLAERGETVFGVDRLPPPPAPPRPRDSEVPQIAPAIEAAEIREEPPLPRSFDEVSAQAAGCTRCDLSKARKTVVFGAGSGASGLMLIGEGPGQREDETGHPFVGRAGQLLDRILSATSLRRKDLYITNIVKCRPPRNRDPRPEEVQSCRPFLNHQVEALKPRLIVAMGRPAAQSLLRTGLSLSALRGRVHRLGNTPLLVTYHPAYLLRSPGQKARAWEDWRRIRNVLAQLNAGGEVSIEGEDAPL